MVVVFSSFFELSFAFFKLEVNCSSFDKVYTVRVREREGRVREAKRRGERRGGTNLIFTISKLFLSFHISEVRVRRRENL
jgi:hypothetical protein